MRFIIIDPNLENPHGHHILYDTVYAKEAAARGMQPLIVSNRKFGNEEVDGIPVYPYFGTTCYHRYSEDPNFGSLDDIWIGNSTIHDELTGLPADFFLTTDLVCIHTVTETTVLGIVDWIATFPKHRAPRFYLFFMFTPGVNENSSGNVFFDDVAKAVPYREALRRIDTLGLNICLYGTGQQHADQMSILSGSDIPTHALITAFDNLPVQAESDRSRILLFAGDAKINKGFWVLPQLIKEICPAYPDHNFYIHANPTNAWGEALTVAAELKRIAPDYPNLKLSLEPLDGRRYSELISSSGVILLPYDPDEYRKKSSGVAWESIISESHLIVPEDTWLERECILWGGAFQSYSPDQISQISVAIGRALDGFDENAEKAKKSAALFKAKNGVKTLFDQIMDDFVRTGGLLDLPAMTQSEIAPEAFEGKGWHLVEQVKGKSARWSEDKADLDIRFPSIGDWVACFHIAKGLIPGHLDGARVSIDGEEAQTWISDGQDGSWRLNVRFRERDPTMPLRTMALELLAPLDVPDEPRKLGLLISGLSINEQSDCHKLIPMATFPKSGTTSTGWTDRVDHGIWTSVVPESKSATINFELPEALTVDQVRQIKVFFDGKLIPHRYIRNNDWAVQAFVDEALIDNPDQTQTIHLIFGTTTSVRMGYLQLFSAMTEFRMDHETLPAVAESLTIPIEHSAPKEHAGSAIQKGNWNLQSLDQFETLQILTVLVSGYQSGIKYFDEFTLKIHCAENYDAIELRNTDGAFQFFDELNQTVLKEDDWGQYVRLFVDKDGNGFALQLQELASDLTEFSKLLSMMQKGVEMALSGHGDDVQSNQLTRAAENLSRLANSY